MCLAITRRALPKYGRIIDIVEPHECPEEPVEIDLTPVDVPTFVNVPDDLDKDTFVQNLNGLSPPTIGTNDLKDRRKIENVKDGTSSSAPRTLLDSVKAMHNTTPVRDIKDEPKEE
jgi:hypothetical protein